MFIIWILIQITMPKYDWLHERRVWYLKLESIERDFRLDNINIAKFFPRPKQDVITKQISCILRLRIKWLDYDEIV
jgi:hypothetical protein